MSDTCELWLPVAICAERGERDVFCKSIAGWFNQPAIPFVWEFDTIAVCTATAALRRSKVIANWTKWNFNALLVD
jgi:hypothetical protein